MWRHAAIKSRNQICTPDTSQTLFDAPALLGMLRHALLGESEPVVAGDGSGDAFAELLTTDVGWHAAEIAAHDPHGIAPIAHPGAMMNGGLGGGTVDNGDEVICDDDSVLAFLRGVLRNDALFEDFHS